MTQNTKISRERSLLLKIFCAIMGAAAWLWVPVLQAETVAAGGNKPVIKIGVVLPLTGNSAALGEMGKEGVEMKLREMGAGSRFEYRVIMEDDALVYSRTAMAVKKLKEADRVDVMITMWGYGSEIALGQLGGSDIFHLNVDRWTDGRGANDFVCGSSIDSHAEKLYALLRKLNVRSVVYIGTAEQGTEKFRKKMMVDFPRMGIKTMDSIVLSGDAIDLRTAVLKIKELKPDLVIDGLQTPTAQIFLKQKRELGCETPVGHITTGVFQAEGTLSEGQWLVYVSPPTKAWQKRFEAETGKRWDYPAAQFYNTFGLLTSACERLPAGKKPTAREIIESMKAMKTMPGATGLLYFREPNHFEAPVSYFVFHKGKAEEVGLEDIK